MQSTDTMMNVSALKHIYFLKPLKIMLKNIKSLQTNTLGTTYESANISRQTNERKEERTDNIGFTSTTMTRNKKVYRLINKSCYSTNEY